MPDPLRHEDVVRKSTRMAVGTLHGLLCHIVDDQPELHSIVASAMCFLDVCQSADIEAFAVLEQIADLDDCGQLDLTPRELEQLDLPLDTRIKH